MNTSAFVVVLCVLGLHQVVSIAIHQEGFCTFYEECGRNPSINISLIKPIIPCVYRGPAKNLSSLHYQRLKDVCPMLDNGENNTYACCSIDQLNSLEESLTLSKSLLVRCPSCAENFAHIHCINTCSPNQSLHINITRTVNVTINAVQKEAVVEYQAYLSRTFADDSFNSCKNVRIPSTGGFAIATMCGRYGVTRCNTQRWLDFQGDSSNGLAPLDIDFRLIPAGTTVGQGIVPYNGRAQRCNESTSLGGEACSCQDCIESCLIDAPPVSSSGAFKIGQLDGVLVVCLVVFIALSLSFLGFILVRNLCRGRSKDKGKDKSDNVVRKAVLPSDVRFKDRASLATQHFLGSLFQSWGTLMASHPIKVIIISLVIVSAFAAGLVKIELTTDPVELWSAPNSRARKEKDFHDKHFDPFFRTNQLILTAPGRPGYTYDSLLFGKQNFSGIISKDLILQLLELQTRLQSIEFWSENYGRNVTLSDICFAPLNPSNPALTDCAVNSLVQYFQNSKQNLDAKVNMTEDGKTMEVDWRDHFIYCVNSPLSFQDVTDLSLSCMADYGAPVFPFLAVGGYEGSDYTNAEALILTFSLNNYPRNDVKFKLVQIWEQMFLDIVQEYQRDPSTNFTFAYMAERSLEDEINRTTMEDIPIFMISYLVIFVYIAVALGEYSSCRRILVDSKLLLGLGGILVVGCSVLASMGFYAWIGIPSSLVILQVVPFLVLAVGADNIFIFVLEFQRDERKPEEKREEQIGRVLGSVAPSMLLCSLSESVCFFLGALSSMPAVKSFALYAALAVLMDFLLQMTAFVALLSLDARRQDASRCDVLCCVTVGGSEKKGKSEGFLLPAIRRYYAPFLLHNVTRVAVMVLFLFIFCSGIFLMFHVKVGLDQELALPQDSYMLEYFKYLYKYFEVGVPTYFVTTGGYNFSSVSGMNGVCSSVGCDPYSLTQKIQYATNFPKESYLAIPASSWVDDFIDWLNPGSRCCRLYTFGPQFGQFCPANESGLICMKRCMKPNATGVLRPNVEEFHKYLPYFLNDRPDLQCSKGGLGAYDKAVVRNEKGDVIASRFMAYHTPLTNSQEFTNALQKARKLAENITMGMRKILGTDPDFEVFPYTITYVFYEQYLSIVPEGIFSISMCLLPTFVVCCILLGMDLLSGLLNLLTIVMITVDTVGVMTLWGIDYNAVSLINLVTAVGISVEFVSHLTRTFAISTKTTRVERAKEATANMGSAVFAGVAMTNLPGIVVLAFAKAQLIQLFFFRLNLVITLLGMAHGLIFLPVLLSYFGPDVNRAVLLELQEKKEQKDSTCVNHVYLNTGFNDSEKNLHRDTSTMNNGQPHTYPSNTVEGEPVQATSEM
ncbi:NPCL1 protein, partial [Atractosteus spatula]|nr:NPCL1 protein [Atractosteus spatula]